MHLQWYSLPPLYLDLLKLIKMSHLKSHIRPQLCWHCVGVARSRLFEHLPLLCQLASPLTTGFPHEQMDYLEIPGGSQEGHQLTSSTM